MGLEFVHLRLPSARQVLKKTSFAFFLVIGALCKFFLFFSFLSFPFFVEVAVPKKILFVSHFQKTYSVSHFLDKTCRLLLCAADVSSFCSSAWGSFIHDVQNDLMLDHSSVARLLISTTGLAQRPH